MPGHAPAFPCEGVWGLCAVASRCSAECLGALEGRGRCGASFPFLQRTEVPAECRAVGAESPDALITRTRLPGCRYGWCEPVTRSIPESDPWNGRADHEVLGADLREPGVAGGVGF